MMYHGVSDFIGNLDYSYFRNNVTPCLQGNVASITIYVKFDDSDTSFTLLEEHAMLEGGELLFRPGHDIDLLRVYPASTTDGDDTAHFTLDIHGCFHPHRE